MAIKKKYTNKYNNTQIVEVVREAQTKGYTFCRNEKGKIFLAVTEGLKDIN